MADNFQKGQPLPSLVNTDDSDERFIIQLKKLISKMTYFDSNIRNNINGVETHLRYIQGNIIYIKRKYIHYSKRNHF